MKITVLATSCKIPLCCNNFSNKNWKKILHINKQTVVSVCKRSVKKSDWCTIILIYYQHAAFFIFSLIIFFLLKEEEALFTWCVYFHFAFSWSYNTVHVVHLYCCYHTVSMQTCLWIICFDKGVWKDRTFSKWGNI